MVNKANSTSSTLNEARQRILDAALAEFSEKGYDGARVGSIAQRAEVNKALIYYYFRSKNELLLELLERFRKDRLQVRETLMQESDERDFPDRVARADVDYLFSRRDVLRVALMEDLKSPAQGGAFLEHWVSGLEEGRKVYEKQGYSFRYTPRVLTALFFYQLLPTVAFATLGEAFAKKTGIGLEQIRLEFLQLVRETTQRHYDTVFASSLKDAAPEATFFGSRKNKSERDLKAAPLHLQTSAEEKAALIAKYVVHGRVIKFPLKEKAKVVLLEYFSELFDVRKIYTEKQVNEMLRAVVDDYAKVRRYLVDYGYLGRRPDGSAYWSRV
ncbi:MAG: hypothetical protein AUK31_07070 [Fibrobacteres bacterium CG2_30_45_31]|nr:MAG: hypothetical protein AUK31_07070 [Fibrobacteres bacterium CG2_30_45_31]